MAGIAHAVDCGQGRRCPDPMAQMERLSGITHIFAPQKVLMDTTWIKIINQVFEMEKKVAAKPEMASLQRNIDRIKAALEDVQITYHSPLGERYNETRTDCEANIVGELKADMVIADVIKPVIFDATNGAPVIVQKAVVLVQNK
jgi:hypothetical protein